LVQFADLKSEWRKGFIETDEEKKAALNKVFIEETLPRVFGKLTVIKEANPGPWLVGKNVSNILLMPIIFTGIVVRNSNFSNNLMTYLL